MKCKTAPHKIIISYLKPSKTANNNIEKEIEPKTEIVEIENPVPQLYPEIIAWGRANI